MGIRVNAPMSGMARTAKNVTHGTPSSRNAARRFDDVTSPGTAPAAINPTPAIPRDSLIRCRDSHRHRGHADHASSAGSANHGVIRKYSHHR
jgi:hypothetical protein